MNGYRTNSIVGMFHVRIEFFPAAAEEEEEEEEEAANYLKQGFKMRFRRRFRFSYRYCKIALIPQSRSISRLSQHENAVRATPKPFQRGRFVTVGPHFESMNSQAKIVGQG